MSLNRRLIWQNLPDSPGVYLFENKAGETIYVGKATSLKNRVASYFTGQKHGKTAELVTHIDRLKIKTTETPLEALFLEADLIKKYRPIYNIKGLDDKSFLHIVITNEKYPRVLLSRPTDPEFALAKRSYGPYLQAYSARVGLDILRQIFPFRHSLTTKRACLNCQLTRQPEVCTGELPLDRYRENLRGLELFLKGQKKRLIKELKAQMELRAQKEEYEAAAQIRNQLFALSHLNDMALLSKKVNFSGSLENEQGIVPERIEAYDIANLNGQYAVGSLVSFMNGEIDKSGYRRFKIKTVTQANDVAMLVEVLTRRLNHLEWPLPNLIMLDGGQGQFNAIQRLLKEKHLAIDLIAFAKGRNRRGETIIGADPKVKYKLELLWALRDEAHRFANTYYQKLHRRQFQGRKEA